MELNHKIIFDKFYKNGIKLQNYKIREKLARCYKNRGEESGDEPLIMRHDYMALLRRFYEPWWKASRASGARPGRTRSLFFSGQK